MSIVVKFRRGEGSGVESNRMDFARVMLDSIKSIVRSIIFNNKRLVGDPVRKNWSGGKGRLEGFK